MPTSYRLMRMEPRTPDFPGSTGRPELVGQLDVDLGAGWPPAVALFIDVGGTPNELIGDFVMRVRDSLEGLFPPGRTLYVPVRGMAEATTHLYRLEPEPPDPEAVDSLLEANADLTRKLFEAQSEAARLRAEVITLRDANEELLDQLHSVYESEGLP